MALDDSQGNVLGPRGTFTYTDNAGVTYNISLDRSVATAVGNTLSDNAALPNLTSSGTVPVSPRGIHVRSVDEPSKRKFIVIGDPANALFASKASSTVTINGEVYVVTGRRGEKSSTLAIDGAGT